MHLRRLTPLPHEPFGSFMEAGMSTEDVATSFATFMFGLLGVSLALRYRPGERVFGASDRSLGLARPFRRSCSIQATQVPVEIRAFRPPHAPGCRDLLKTPVVLEFGLA
jgi:hypothetical protein